MAESALPLQQDTVSTVPGGGVRMATVVVMIGGVPTPVQMQVVAVAGPDGQFVDWAASVAVQQQILFELRELRRLMGQAYGIAVFVPDTVGADSDSTRT